MKTSYILVAIRAPSMQQLKRNNAALRREIHKFADKTGISIADNCIPPADCASGWAQGLLRNIMARRMEWPE
jgi:hypothetical protein